MHFDIASLIVTHGILIIGFVVFFEAIGLPIPASIALVISGAAAAKGHLNPFQAFFVATAAMMAGDALMFFLGRYLGWRMLGFLCKLSLDTESCILRSAETFYKRGKTVLVIAKFLPAINTMAPPLAGSMNMSFWLFFLLDLIGTLLYVAFCFGAGFLFSDLLAVITSGYERFGSAVGILTMVAVAAYVAYMAWRFWQSKRVSDVPVTSPEQAAADSQGVLFDVRSHGYYDRGAQRAAGSRRLEPNGLHLQYNDLPKQAPIYLYCTCSADATSIHVARLLQKQGFDARVVSGGMSAWNKAGLPTEGVPEGETIALPSFR